MARSFCIYTKDRSNNYHLVPVFVCWETRSGIGWLADRRRNSPGDHSVGRTRLAEWWPRICRIPVSVLDRKSASAGRTTVCKWKAKVLGEWDELIFSRYEQEFNRGGTRCPADRRNRSSIKRRSYFSRLSSNRIAVNASEWVLNSSFGNVFNIQSNGILWAVASCHRQNCSNVSQDSEDVINDTNVSGWNMVNWPEGNRRMVTGPHWRGYNKSWNSNSGYVPCNTLQVNSCNCFASMVDTTRCNSLSLPTENFGYSLYTTGMSQQNM